MMPLDVSINCDKDPTPFEHLIEERDIGKKRALQDAADACETCDARAACLLPGGWSADEPWAAEVRAVLKRRSKARERWAV